MYEALDRIKEHKAQAQADTLANKRHHEQQMAALATQEAIYKGLQALQNFMKGHTTKTEVVNQLKEIKTPDALKVAEAVDSLHRSFKNKKDLDLSELTELVKQLLSETKAIPKDKIEIDIPSSVEVSNQKDYTEQFTNMLKAIQAIKLVAEAPVVNVDAPVVQVDAPDLKPLTKEIKTAFTKAINAINFPEYKTDNSGVEKLLKKSNKLLDEIAMKPMGGGGGGRVSPYETSNGMPSFVTLQEGAVPITEAAFALKIAESGTDTYVAEAAPGTADSTAGWRIQKIDSNGNITWKDGNASFDNTATDITTGTFS